MQHDDGGAEVLEQHDLAPGVAAGHGDHRGPQAFGAVVGAQAAGEQAVAVGVVDDIAPVGAGRGQGPGHELGPGLQVPCGVGHRGGFAGGAGAGVNPHHLLHGHGEHAEGVIVPQILFSGEG